jgi:GDPmannose 4,6-dehydratase
LGDSSKARNKLWRVPKYDVKTLCKEMVQSDIQLFKQQKILQQHGYTILEQYE